MKKTKYLKCIKQWSSLIGLSIIGKIYRTDVATHFSSHSWDEILNYPGNDFSDWTQYFISCSEEEWSKQEEITIQYQIY